VLTGREAEGRDLIDRIYTGILPRLEATGGVADQALSGQIQPFVFVLEDTGLTEDAERFRMLLPEQLR